MNPTDPPADESDNSSPSNDASSPKSKTDSTMSSRRLNVSLTRRIIRRLVVFFFISVAVLFFLSMTSSSPDNLGVNSGRLAPCPDSPNCVSTQANNPEQQMAPIAFNCPPDEMLKRIKQTIDSNYPRAKLISELDHYLHFEFRSLIFRFVDDVEFLVDDKTSVVHFRSASRVGHSDLGANRKRMKQISESLNQ